MQVCQKMGYSHATCLPPPFGHSTSGIPVDLAAELRPSNQPLHGHAPNRGHLQQRLARAHSAGARLGWHVLCILSTF